MSTMAMAIPAYDPWCVDYHRTMAATLAACKAVKNRALMITLAKDFWVVSKDFKALLSELDQVTHIQPAELRIATDRLRELYRNVNRTLDVAAKYGLQKKTLTGASLRSVRDSNVRLLDVIERFELSLDQSLADLTRQALEEYERGETVSLDSLV